MEPPDLAFVKLYIIKNSKDNYLIIYTTILLKQNFH